jgi:citrate lyase subunit beta/citryl-CoA lyase
LSGFAPGEVEIAWAARILADGEEAAAKVDGVTVDAPVRAKARRILTYKNR